MLITKEMLTKAISKIPDGLDSEGLYKKLCEEEPVLANLLGTLYHAMKTIHPGWDTSMRTTKLAGYISAAALFLPIIQCLVDERNLLLQNEIFGPNGDPISAPDVGIPYYDDPYKD